MSEKKRQKKDGQDKNKKLQARRADNDEQQRAGAGTVRQGRANSEERGDAPSPRQSLLFTVGSQGERSQNSQGEVAARTAAVTTGPAGFAARGGASAKKTAVTGEPPAPSVTASSQEVHPYPL
jgi:hypothetical protein